MANYLMKRGDTWHVKVSIPKDVQYAFGGHRAFKRSLKTSDKHIANALSAPLVVKFKAEIKKARANPTAFRRDTLELSQDVDSYDLALLDEMFASKGIKDPDDAPASVVDAYKLATGQIMPFDGPLEDYAKSRRVELKTAAKDRHAITKFATRVPAIQRVDKRVVREFVKHLSAEEGVKNRTIKDNLSTLRVYWKWLQDHSLADEDKVNPFVDVSLPPENRKETAEKVRLPFTVDHIRTLNDTIMGGKDEMLQAIFTLAIYTGCRIEELARLEAVNVTTETINIVRAKTTAGNRTIPVHGNLKPLVADLLSRGDKYLLPDLTDNKIGVRSSLMSKRFGKLKTRMGFDSKYVFHSIRKTVATQWEHAGLSEGIAADLLGHDKPTMTYGVYAGGSSMQQKQDAIALLDYGIA